MEQRTTLSQFIDEQVTKFNIKNTEENQKSLRVKFTRELKKLGIWQNAPTKLIGRKHTKTFSWQELQILYQRVEKYLLKRSNLDLEKLKEFRENNARYFEHIHNIDYDKIREEELAEQYMPDSRVTEKEKINLMIEALFYQFFGGINFEKWKQDKEIIDYLDINDEEEMNRIDVFQASTRLNNPVQSYVIEKKETKK